MIDLKTCRVLVTPRSFGEYDPDLRTCLEAEVGEVIYNPTGRPLTAKELKKLIPGIDGYIAGLDTITREVIEAADRLKVIARYGVGVDAVDLDAAKERGIVVTNTPGANSTAVAELAIGLMLSLARNIPLTTQAVRRGEWPRMRGRSLEGKTVGLIGFGSIGREVARRLIPFGCKVIIHDPFGDEQYARDIGVALVSSDAVVSQADFLSLHCPVLPETRRMVDSRFLRRMKPGAYLINTARGELVDEDALCQAVREGHLGGAALDVFARQPPNSDSPLLSLPNIITTPHMGAHTDGATNGMGWGALMDCLAVLRGEKPANPVTAARTFTS